MDTPQILDWLLESDNPPVRFLTLVHLLEKPLDDPDVLEARERLGEYEVTRQILSHAGEFWRSGDPYQKYRGRYWQLIFLGSFLADGTDPRIREGVSVLLDDPAWVSARGGQCLTANVLTALTRLGYGEHPRVVQEREALAERIVEANGIDCAAMDYSILRRCFMAQPKLLRCFAQVEPQNRSGSVSTAVRILRDDLVNRNVFQYVPAKAPAWKEILAGAPKRAQLPPGRTVVQWVAQRRERFLAEEGIEHRKAKSGWTRFGFPLHYNSDILEAMYTLALLGTPMLPQLEEALSIIEKKRTGEGCWILENSLNGKMWADVEEAGKPSKWLTCFALQVLKHFRNGAGV